MRRTIRSIVGGRSIVQPSRSGAMIASLSAAFSSVPSTRSANEHTRCVGGGRGAHRLIESSRPASDGRSSAPQHACQASSRACRRDGASCAAPALTRWARRGMKSSLSHSTRTTAAPELVVAQHAQTEIDRRLHAFDTRFRQRPFHPGDGCRTRCGPPATICPERPSRHHGGMAGARSISCRRGRPDRRMSAIDPRE